MYNNEFGNEQKYSNDSLPIDSKTFEDSAVVRDNPVPDEIVEQPTSTIKTKKKDTVSLLKMSSMLIGCTAAVGIIAPAVANANISISVQFGEIIVTNTSISYDLIIENTEEIDLYLSLTNDFTNRVVLIDGDTITSTFTDLKENMRYKLSVYTSQTFGEKTIASTYVTTLSEKDYKIARFDGVDTICKCNVDGYFYFTMNYVDNIEAFSNFEAYLIDDYENTSYCEFNEDYKTTQKIIVSDSALDGNEATLIINYDCVIDGKVERLSYSGKVAI